MSQSNGREINEQVGREMKAERRPFAANSAGASGWYGLSDGLALDLRHHYNNLRVCAKVLDESEGADVRLRWLLFIENLAERCGAVAARIEAG